MDNQTDLHQMDSKNDTKIPLKQGVVPNLKSVKEFQCGGCDISYMRKDHLKMHVARHHSIGKSSYLSQKKGKSTATKSKDSSAIIDVDAWDMDNENVMAKGSNKKQKKLQRDVPTAIQSSDSFIDVDAFDENKSTLDCKICSKTFSQKKNLNRHLKSHTKTPKIPSNKTMQTPAKSISSKTPIPPSAKCMIKPSDKIMPKISRLSISKVPNGKVKQTTPERIPSGNAPKQPKTQNSQSPAALSTPTVQITKVARNMKANSSQKTNKTFQYVDVDASDLDSKFKKIVVKTIKTPSSSISKSNTCNTIGANPNQSKPQLKSKQIVTPANKPKKGETINENATKRMLTYGSDHNIAENKEKVRNLKRRLETDPLFTTGNNSKRSKLVPAVGSVKAKIDFYNSFEKSNEKERLDGKMQWSSHNVFNVDTLYALASASISSVKTEAGQDGTNKKFISDIQILELEVTNETDNNLYFHQRKSMNNCERSNDRSLLKDKSELNKQVLNNFEMLNETGKSENDVQSKPSESYVIEEPLIQVNGLKGTNVEDEKLENKHTQLKKDSQISNDKISHIDDSELNENHLTPSNDDYKRSQLIRDLIDDSELNKVVHKLEGGPLIQDPHFQDKNLKVVNEKDDESDKPNASLTQNEVEECDILDGPLIEYPDIQAKDFNNEKDDNLGGNQIQFENDSGISNDETPLKDESELNKPILTQNSVVKECEIPTVDVAQIELSEKDKQITFVDGPLIEGPDIKAEEFSGNNDKHGGKEIDSDIPYSEDTKTNRLEMGTLNEEAEIQFNKLQLNNENSEKVGDEQTNLIDNCEVSNGMAPNEDESEINKQCLTGSNFNQECQIPNNNASITPIDEFDKYKDENSIINPSEVVESVILNIQTEIENSHNTYVKVHEVLAKNDIKNEALVLENSHNAYAKVDEVLAKKDIKNEALVLDLDTTDLDNTLVNDDEGGLVNGPYISFVAHCCRFTTENEPCEIPKETLSSEQGLNETNEEKNNQSTPFFGWGSFVNSTGSPEKVKFSI